MHVDDDTKPDLGDEITDANRDIAAERERDASGRFAKADDKTDATDADAEKVKADLAEKAAAEAEAAKAGEKEPVDDEEEEEEAKPEKESRLTRRIAKITSDRDTARAQAEQARIDLAIERAANQQRQVRVNPLDTLNKELDTLYEKVEEARADGDRATAARLQREIDTKNRLVTRMESEPEVERKTAQAIENNRFNSMLEVVEARIPSLDPRHEDFDPTAAGEIEFQVQAYEKAGMAPSDALRRAILLVYREDPFGKQAAVAQGKEVDKPVAKKKETDIAKNLDAKKRDLPADVRSAGVEGDKKLDVNKLTDEEYYALPESKRAQLRGDNV